MTELSELKGILALAVSVLSAEHVFSANLSSPWTTGKLAQSQEDKTAFWRLFTEASFASFIFAFAIGLLMRDPKALALSLLGTTAIVAWLYWDYSRALSGALYANSASSNQQGVTTNGDSLPVGG